MNCLTPVPRVSIQIITRPWAGAMKKNWIASTISLYLFVICMALMSPVVSGASESAATSIGADSYIPPFLAVWDLKSANSTVSKRFVVTAHRYYDFQIAFQGAITGPSNEARIEQFNEFKRFVGDGGSEWVTKESADTDTPVVLSEAMDAHQQHQMMQSGQYVARMTRSGVMIPVHLVIKASDANGSIAILYDKTIKTWNFEAGSGDGILRHITSVELRPGTYSVLATCSRAIAVPPHVTTLLRVSYRADSRQLDD